MATLVICEKNNAAQRVAGFLARGKYMKTYISKVPVFRFPWKDTECIVVGLRGHILNLDYPREFKNWDIDRLEELVSIAPLKKATVPWILNVIKDLGKQVDTVIVATDFDREGELIGAEAISVMELRPDIVIKRARFSALTGPEIYNAFDNLIELDRNLALAAETRQIVDLAWGAVLTRFMSTATGKQGSDFLSVGRVQSPTLALVVDREKEIETFIPKPFWEIIADLEKKRHFFARHSHGLFWEKEEADKIFEIVKDSKDAKITAAKVEEVAERPPSPFSTTAFLAEASKMGFSAARAMSIAESLYNDGLISYPRTDNTVYPHTLPLKSILGKLAQGEFATEVEIILKQEKLRPSRGPKQTTDHPPIHPVELATREKTIGDNWRIYELVVRRFLATLGPDAFVLRSEATLNIGGEDFIAQGHETLDNGWRDFYPYFKFTDVFIPELKEGETINVVGVRGREGKTEPPRRYTQGILIREMEKLGLGTKSTRHEIVQKLFDRGYVQGGQIRPTASGRVIIIALEDNAEQIVRPEMTRKLEEDMNTIAEGNQDQASVVKESQEMLAKCLEVLMANREKIRTKVNEALKNQNQMGVCPKCGKGSLVTRKSKRGKRFMACDAYPNCENTYPLPQFGALLPHAEMCKVCSGPQVKLVMSKRKPVDVCLDMNCKANKDRMKKSRKGKAAPKAKYVPKAKASGTKKSGTAKKAKKDIIDSIEKELSE
ncbi:MAG: DNA topoisomerase I [Candidatus Thermoplasmatota archaeon]|nr:DNA topoisomerase I [Euryarchaeota archaeon]MBU4033043.1 DNA topoisomerase I [Candidatus Thermoplasmatota archaeon]MBU4070686.1 DNA topoisomerase I [Candidatus Thermoplasmatota archaeon]MBU4143702.1 DNA topoisomerase I [Candidatus Thermoplasmatota archaeon]MBU4591784.1 DNA topoisomerase I [Candidatus Thermoplasmatota archaeon]